MRGEARAAFAAVLLFIAGVLNIIYGIAAIDEAKFFVGNTQYVFEDVKTWGWITTLLGVVQLTGSLSLFAGQTWGRIVGLTAATFGAIGALLAVGGAHPFWSLGVFAICVIVIHGLVVFGEPREGSSA